MLPSAPAPRYSDALRAHEFAPALDVIKPRAEGAVGALGCHHKDAAIGSVRTGVR